MAAQESTVTPLPSSLYEPPSPFDPPNGAFSTKWIEHLPSPPERIERADALHRGLSLRVLPTGSRSFFWKTEIARPDGTKYRPTISLGEFGVKDGPGVSSLQTARKRLDWIREQAKGGLHAFERAREKLEAEIAGRDSDAAATPSVYEVGETWYRSILPTGPDDRRGWKSHETLRRILDKAIYPAIGPVPCASVTPVQCGAIIESVAKRGLRSTPRPAPTQAGKVLSHLSALFRFATLRGWMTVDGRTFANPTAALGGGEAFGASQGQPADRALTLEEIPVFWRYLDTLAVPIGPAPTTVLAFRILLLTGVRPCELVLARREEIDLKAAVWRVPPENRKMNPRQRANRKLWVDWMVPLAPQVVRLFEELFRAGGDSAFAVPGDTDEDAPLSENVLANCLSRMYGRKVPLKLSDPQKLTPYDLRHTLRTHLNTLGVDFAVAERCLCHSLGKIPETYVSNRRAPSDRADYLVQRREALAKWADLVDSLLTGTGAKVVPLRATR